MYPRFSSVGTFAEIARENFDSFSDHEHAVAKIRADNSAEPRYSEYELMAEENKMRKSGVIVIVFAAMAVEAYVYDYAARNLTDSFTENYLDKLDTLAKWMLVPRLITGKELPKDNHAFQLLTNLIKARNKIVHSKSKSLPNSPSDEFWKTYRESRDTFPKQVKDAIKTMDTLAIAIEEIDEKEFATCYFDSPIGKNLTAKLS